MGNSWLPLIRQLAAKAKDEGLATGVKKGQAEAAARLIKAQKEVERAVNAAKEAKKEAEGAITAAKAKVVSSFLASEKGKKMFADREEAAVEAYRHSETFKDKAFDAAAEFYIFGFRQCIAILEAHDGVPGDAPIQTPPLPPSPEVQVLSELAGGAAPPVSTLTPAGPTPPVSILMPAGPALSVSKPIPTVVEPSPVSVMSIPGPITLVSWEVPPGSIQDVAVPPGGTPHS